MSKKTVSQMEAELMDKIQKAQERLEALQLKQKIAIGNLAYKYNLHQFEMRQLDLIFSKFLWSMLMDIIDEIKTQKQTISRCEKQLALEKLRKRRADTRRKIELGGLVVKSGMDIAKHLF